MTGAPKYNKIRDYILGLLGGHKIKLSDGKNAVVDKSDALHIANKAASKKISQISKIKEIIEKAKLYAEDNNVEHNKFDYFCYYRAFVRVGEETVTVYLNVGKGISDGKYYIYDITNKIRDTAHRINGVERPKPNEGYAQKNDISTYSITSIKEKINTSDEKNSKPLNDETPIGADSNENLSQDELRATLEAKVSNVVNVLKINQKEKISSTVTPQQAFDDMRDLSINSIPENTEKVNTLDEKNP